MKAIMIAVALAFGATAGFAQSHYPTPTKNGRERIPRTDACPTGYVGLGNFCEALHKDTPRAYKPGQAHARRSRE